MKKGAAAVLVFLVFLAIFAGRLAPFEINRVDLLNEYKGFSAVHWLGQGLNGIDIWTHILWGLRRSLSLSFSVALLCGVLGLVVGILSSFYTGFWDSFFRRVIDFVNAFPSFLIFLIVAGLAPTSFFSFIVILSLTNWSSIALLTRVLSKQILKEGFVESVKAQGGGTTRIVFVHLLPVLFPQIAPYIVVVLRRAILAEAALSFLGIGLKASDASLGALLAQGKDALWAAPHLLFLPGCVISLLISTLLLLSDGKQGLLAGRIRG